MVYLVLFVLVGTGVTLAQPGRLETGRMPMKGQGVEQAPGARLNSFLNLTDEQAEAAKQIRFQEAKELKTLKDQLRELKARQQTLTTAAKPDMNDIYKNIEKIGDVKVGIAKVLAKKQQEFRALLSEEQLLKLDSRKGQLKEPPVKRLPQERRRGW